MKIGILGLGLIGGSFARAFALAGHTVYAHNRSQDTLAFAQLAGAVDAPLTQENIGSCDLILLSIYPEGSVQWLEENARLMIAAMRECATNTVRHAGGSEMTVRLTRTQKADIAVITNNGKPPEGGIVEGGGLSGLRRSVENRHGTMEVRGEPAFRLSIVLPREEEPR